jgi:hypothetical protein
MSKSLPILFSGEMVRAILAGRKTVTRRIVKSGKELAPASANFRREPSPNTYGEGWLADWPHEYGRTRMMDCPYGRPDHPTDRRLWVRETFCPRYFDDGSVGYRADFNAKDLRGLVTEPKWKPSIFMRQSESRITLDVTGARVERLHEITEEDARAEGAECGSQREGMHTARDAFAVLWDSINGKRAAWGTNPWVWVVEFSRVVTT